MARAPVDSTMAAGRPGTQYATRCGESSTTAGPAGNPGTPGMPGSRLAAPARSRRHHLHRVSRPAQLHPRWVLRRVGTAARTRSSRTGQGKGHGDLRRPGVPGQPPQRPAHRARADPA